MGVKRTFEAEDVQELNMKHAREISYSNKLGVPFHVSLEKSGLVIGEDLSDDLYGFKCEDNVETNAPFSSWITSEEDDATTQSTLSHESPESDYDVDWCQFSPRKQVPIGSDYQADIPECVKEEVSEEQVMGGECVIPIPDRETEVFEIGKGRKECICVDKGSIRCVQQHIMESREGLFGTIGYERCLNIGLGEMGEEVAGKLTEEEEDLFHEVVYSNPVSLDRDFWKHLKSAFPSRTMKDIVSYYFNVFILRRRAVQNRSRSLDVDSDDDEWQAEYDNAFYGPETPVEKTVESLSRGEEDSCMSDDFQSNVNREVSDFGNYWRHCNDLVEDHSYTFDHCWSKNIDLLPTSNIIDEIFGQENPWDQFSRSK
ncbi:hypothetical protein HA466_0110660 [Hirschfeldia incana]|nr:hypothetical protein HA466_0110660 [Hirschfeldia incana]